MKTRKISIAVFFVTAISLVLGREVAREESKDPWGYYNPIIVQPADSCKLSIDYFKGDLKEPQPLLLTDEVQPRFLLPNEKGLIVVPNKVWIILACPGFYNGLNNFNGRKWMRFACLGGTRFFAESIVYDFKTLNCSQLPKETVRKSNQRCLQNHDLYDIGFNLDHNTFLPLLEICRDDKDFITYYSKAIITKRIANFQSGYPRPYWKYGSFYPGLNMNFIYKRESQIRSLGLQLGSEELAKKYLRLNEQYLNRGHLAAKADFVFGAHQMTTFWHLNTAPQWMSFNAGNWVSLEQSVRKFASDRAVDLIVYTGTHGIASLENVHGKRQPIFLYANLTTKAIPVPKYFWKVIHDPRSNRAVGFVGVNEPFESKVLKNLYICNDIGQDPAYSWVRWKPENVTLGISYICSVDDLREAVPTVPDIGQVGLLV